MSRLALAVAVVAASSSIAEAGYDLAAGDDPLDLPTRRVRHIEASERAAAAGDPVLAARQMVLACDTAAFESLARGVEVCGRAYKLVEAAGDPLAKAEWKTVRGCQLGWQLKWDESKAALDEALALHGERPSALRRQIRACIGAMAAEMGDYTLALAELTRVRDDARAAGHEGDLMFADAWVCRVRWMMGELDAAEPGCRRAARLAAKIGNKVGAATAYWNLGNIERDRGRDEPGVELFKRSLQASLEVHMPFFVAIQRDNLALAYIELGRFDEAAAQVAELDAMLASGSIPPFYRFGIEWIRGELEAARGNPGPAIAALEVAVQSPMDHVAIQAMTVLGAVHRRAGDYRAARATYRAAIERIERSRARTPGERGRAAYLERHAAVYRSMVSVIADESDRGGAAEALEVAEAGRARALIDALRAAGADIEPTRPLSAAAIESHVPEGARLVVYVSAESRLLAIAASRERLELVELGGAGDREALAARVDFYRRLVRSADTPAPLQAAGQALFRDLVAPVAGDADMLVIAADGPLHHLPFGALIDGDGRFLIETTDIAVVPSASLLEARAGSPGSTAPLMSVASPPVTGSLPPLPASVIEARSLDERIAGEAILLTGRDATEAHFRQAKPGRFALLHFATHAVIDDRLPLRSGLLMAPDPNSGDDGWLRADEIYKLHLGADLVLLSACRTGLGRIELAEGPLSLARAFLYAGAGAVIATLWDVEDRYGALMVDVVDRAAGGTPVVTALARAKRAAIAAGLPPRSWAGYVAIGRPQLTIGVERVHRDRWPRLPLVIGGLAAVGALLVLVGLWLRTGRRRRS